MKLETDVAESSVSLTVPKAIYSSDALKIAAAVFEGRADVLASESRSSYELTLRSQRAARSEEELRALGGEFFNELLNQEYRFIVSRFNKRIADLIVAQTLLSARGGENPPAPPAEEQTVEFKAQVARMMKEAEEDARRTMPRKLPPQGAPLPPAKDEPRA